MIRKKSISNLLIICGCILLIFSACSDKSESDERELPDISDPSSACRGRSTGYKNSNDLLTNLKMPFASTDSFDVSQSWFGSFSHSITGAEHAIDFSMTDGESEILAVGPGRVVAVKEDSNTTCTTYCDDANYVIVDHGQGYYGKYAHFCLDCVDVEVGALITSGNYKLGLAGNTGYSTGAHLHFEMLDWEENCSVEYDLEGSTGDLTVGQTYTSSNEADQSTYSSSTISGNAYINQGIYLISSFSWYQQAGASIAIEGRITDTNSSIGIVLLDADSTEVDDSIDTFETTASDKNFTRTYSIPSVLSAGTYYIVISSSDGTSVSYSNPPYFVVY